MCQSGWSSLIVASRNGHVEVVDKLLQHGATVDLLHEVHYATIYFYSIFSCIVYNIHNARKNRVKLFIRQLCIIYYYYSIF